MPHLTRMPWVPADIPGEVWRDVPGYEGRYWVSDHGRAFSSTKQGARLLKPSRGRYMLIVLYGPGSKRSTRNVHVLVMRAFVGPCPVGMEVCHNNGDVTDNRLSNLRYGTPRDNASDSKLHGTNKESRKTHCRNGHKFDKKNTYITKEGTRQCRVCKRERMRRYRP